MIHMWSLRYSQVDVLNGYKETESLVEELMKINIPAYTPSSNHVQICGNKGEIFLPLRCCWVLVHPISGFSSVMDFYVLGYRVFFLREILETLGKFGWMYFVQRLHDRIILYI